MTVEKGKELTSDKLDWKNATLDELTDVVLKRYDEGVEVEQIATSLNVAQYLIASILISQRDVYFR